jgi:hypothetical protein
MSEPVCFNSLYAAEAAWVLGMDFDDIEFYCSVCGKIHCPSSVEYHLRFECLLSLWKKLIQGIIANCYYFTDPDDYRLLEMAIINILYSGEVEASYVNSSFFQNISYHDWRTIVLELAKATRPDFYILTVHPFPRDQLWKRILQKLRPGTLAMMRLNQGGILNGSPTVAS